MHVCQNGQITMIINATSDTIDGSCFKQGCMSDWADNYDSLATIDENSCY